MTTEVLAQALTAGVQATFGQGRVFYVKTASAALTITAEKKGTNASIRRFINIGAGFKFTADAGDGWDYLRVDTGTSQNIELILSDDDVEVANAVSVTGAVTVQAIPASLVNDNAAVSCPTATVTNVVPANLARKRVGISFDSNASIGSATVFFRKQGGVNNLLEVQAGVLYGFDGTYGLDINNTSGGTLTARIFEEV